MCPKLGHKYVNMNNCKKSLKIMHRENSNVYKTDTKGEESQENDN
jgi:hypothetical protein